MTTSPYGGGDPLGAGPVDPLDGSAPGDDGSAMTSSGDSSTVDTAKEKASDALGSASEHGSHVAETAKDEAVKVATEAKEKATDLLSDLRSQVDEQSKAQLKGLSAKLGELADELQDMVSGSEQGGTVRDVAQQLVDKTHQLSSHLEGRQPTDLLEDLRSFARRRPGTFLAGAGIAGVLAGRLTRGAKASPDTGTGGAGSSTSGTSVPQTSTTVGDPPSFGVEPAPVTSSTPVGADDVPLGQNTGGRQ